MGIEQPPTLTPREEIGASHKQLMSLLLEKPDNSVLNKDEIANFKYELKRMGAASKSDDNLSELERQYGTVIDLLGTSPVGDIKRALEQISNQENF